ncbi:poly [ADP-ribose] polymerase 6-like [Sinocyclocheilus rhinocerous]|uniref:poly [ADP-ribose] polymerase 6-like n=1 Tax=Sinocyclocheilus rhinocerous TaxID=307959 RepID=UPI0007B8E9AB|nr:PREDICTED: poly [ADP-ribose] polymerase 6-like [Sinocyclocheilus rhinocerous]
MDIKGQGWTDEESDGENEPEQFLYGIQGSCAADLYRHPQLDADIEAVKDIYTDSAVSVREYGTIDDVDIDLQINIGFLDEEVATAWKVIRTEPIVLRLRFSLSQYLDGPEPSVEVFQPSNKESFSLGLQLKKILSTFTSQQWKHLSNEFLKAQQEKRHSWFKAGGTIKKFRAGLSIFSPIPKSPSFPLIQDTVLKGKLNVPELRVTRLMNRSISCTMKNPKGELFSYPPNSQTVAVPAGRAPAQITTRQLIELFFSSQAGGHCKNIPTLEYGFLVQVPSHHSLSDTHDFILSHDAQSTSQHHIRACRVQRLSEAKYGAAVNLVKGHNHDDGSYLEIKKQMDKLDPLAHPLLQWIISSNRSHIVKLPLSRQLKFMHTSHQFLLLSSPPAKEARFRTAKKLYGSTFAFHGSHIENWHSVLRNGLVNASYTKLQLHGAAYGKGIYLSPISSISFGYSGMGKGQHRMPTKDELVQRYNRMNTMPQSRPIQSRFLQSRNLNCIALCEVITSKDLQKHGNIWVCPVSDHVCTRFFFVYEDGQVGDANINTQEPKIQKEIMRVIGTQIYSS